MFNPLKSQWDEISPESYRIILNECKERMEDSMSESESITSKSFKILIFVVSVLAFFGGYSFTGKIDIGWVIVGAVIFTVNLGYLLKLIAPKNIQPRGIEPQFLLDDQLVDADVKPSQEKCVYYKVVCTLQNNISAMDKRNFDRIGDYKTAINLSVASLIYCAATIGASISHLL